MAPPPPLTPPTTTLRGTLHRGWETQGGDPYNSTHNSEEDIVQGESTDYKTFNISLPKSAIKQNKNNNNKDHHSTILIPLPKSSITNKEINNKEIIKKEIINKEIIHS
jgi:hypothetical protein